jgi:putative nucleotidyltransferase with HDIG domain
MSDPSYPPRNRCLLLGLANAISPLDPEDFLCELTGEPVGRPLLEDVVPVPAEWLAASEPSDYAQVAPQVQPIDDPSQLEGTSGVEAAERELLETMLREAGRDDEELVLHSLRVGMLAEAIAREMGADVGSARMLRRAAVLHDIGKLAVPPDILEKTGILSDEEYETSKLHTVAGAELLEGVDLPLMRVARIVALHHHERWDGTGYPDRLVGTDIPPLARVVAVADAFDALTHERPYKPAWSIEEAVTELARQRGQLHEAAAVDALFRVLRRAGLPLPGPSDRAAAA